MHTQIQTKRQKRPVREGNGHFVGRKLLDGTFWCILGPVENLFCLLGITKERNRRIHCMEEVHRTAAGTSRFISRRERKNDMSQTKKKREIPHIFAILLVMIVIATICTLGLFPPVPMTG